MKKKSEKLIIELKAIRHSQSALHAKLHRAWSRMKKDGFAIERLNEAHSKIYEAESELDVLYAEQIGRAIVREV